MEKKNIIIYLILFILFYKTFFVSEKMTNYDNVVKNMYETLLEDIRKITEVSKKLTSTNELVISNNRGLKVKELYINGIKLTNNNNELIVDNNNSKISFEIRGREALIKTPSDKIYFDKNIYLSTSPYNPDNKYKFVLEGESIKIGEKNNFQPKGNYQPAGEYQPAGNYITTNIKDGYIDIVSGHDSGAGGPEKNNSWQPTSGYLKCWSNGCGLYHNSKQLFWAK